MAYTVRSAEEKLRIVFEGMKAENISAMCRREGISPTDYYRYRDKLVEGGLDALRQNGRQKRDAEKESLKKEVEKLKEIIVTGNSLSCLLWCGFGKNSPLDFC